MYTSRTQGQMSCHSCILITGYGDSLVHFGAKELTILSVLHMEYMAFIINLLPSLLFIS
ncbi:hypothetical protein BDV26DRAFT_261611 [Aspergillus bertholletiae]|uniref:Uncharacterized protein n=1 Tax=Aspergillus bertholletiae TaxID=1226010 RepID=A0A5N7B9I3_9EURO|nr:hypothetical protein BDV26DRAFT_261611 [Aspergillus bertholletiae]